MESLQILQTEVVKINDFDNLCLRIVLFCLLDKPMHRGVRHVYQNGKRHTP